MILNELTGSVKGHKRPKRVGRGRGSGHGRTACRGNRGWKSREGSGGRMYNMGGDLPLYRRIPKRGFNNKWRVEYSTVNVESLNVFEDGEVVSPERLMEKRLVRDGNAMVKILGGGKLRRRLTVSAHGFSASAAQKIQAAGGMTKELAR